MLLALPTETLWILGLVAVILICLVKNSDKADNVDAIKAYGGWSKKYNSQKCRASKSLT